MSVLTNLYHINKTFISAHLTIVKIPFISIFKNIFIKVCLLKCNLEDIQFTNQLRFVRKYSFTSIKCKVNRRRRSNETFLIQLCDLVAPIVLIVRTYIKIIYLVKYYKFKIFFSIAISIYT